jgi:hypothetical protein|tara:strand:+ start:291 stop:608 length:318 start_codon:yes stop_codon:yes gene_type:complete
MSLTVPQVIQIAQVSQYLAENDIDQSGLYGGGQDLLLPVKLYEIRKTIEWYYSQDPTGSTLFQTCNYLIALCGKYRAEASVLLGIGLGSINVIITETENYIITEN